MTTETSINVMQSHLLTIDKLRTSVRQMLKCVINLHIEILVLESNVSQLIDDVKDLNEELLEVQRLDALINALRDYNGPTICHEWPYPLIYKGTIDEADCAQILNTYCKQQNKTKIKTNASKYNQNNNNNKTTKVNTPNGLSHSTTAKRVSNSVSDEGT